MKKGTHGGKRPRSGRKPGKVTGPWTRTLEKQAAAQLYREEVLARMAPLVRAQLEAATGSFARVAVVELTEGGLKLRRVTDEQELLSLVDGGGGTRIVLSEPDMGISKYLTDQVIGKPTESLEVSGPAGGPVRVRFVDVDA